jgi:hypothetical protein
VITITSAAPYPNCFSRRSLRCCADSKADSVIGETTCELPYTTPIRMQNNSVPSRAPALKPDTNNATTMPGLPTWSATYGMTVATLLTWTPKLRSVP